MKKVDNLYYLGIILLTIKMWFFITNLFEVSSLIENLFMISITILFGLKIFFTKSSYKEFCIITIVGIFIFITSRRIMNIDIFLSVLSILAAKDIDIKKAIKYTLKVNLVCITIHIFRFIECYIFEPSKIEYMMDENAVRYTFFMRHPNYLGATLFWALSSYIYLNFNNKRSKNIMLIILIAIITYITCKSRTTIIIFIVLSILILLKDKIKTKTLSKIVKLSFLLSIFISIFVSSNYYDFKGQNKNIVDNLNSVLSGRIKLSAIGLKEYGYTFLGRFIEAGEAKLLAYYGIKRLIIDSFYISCCINYGIFYLFAIGIGLVKLCKKIENKELIFVLLFIIAALTERYVIYSTLVFPLLFFANLYPKRKKEENNI